MKKEFLLLLLFFCPVFWSGHAAQEAKVDLLLFDFEDPADLKSWSNLELPKDKEPPIKLGLSAEHATSGKRSLKLTFAGGHWPTITTTNIQDDWLPYRTFQADVTVSRPCLVGFTILQEKSQRGEGWEALISRWTKTAFLQKGKNRVVTALPQPNEYALSRKWGKVIRFEIFMYAPHDGETVFIDNIRLTMAKEAPPQKREFTVTGTDWVVSGTSSAQAVIELGKKLKSGWKKPEAKTLAQVEEEFRAQYAEWKKKHPGAVLAILRDGEKGYDSKEPEKVYAGWKDAYFNSHGPDGNYRDRSGNRGKSATHEIFMRHRSPLMRVDMSSIPAKSHILAAKLIVVRANDKIQDDHNPHKKPTMWVVEPCNRPWHEYEVNAFEYARDKFWKAVGGMHWDKDADFAPVFLAHGPGQGKVNVWDFTEAVRYWTGGKHPNHGFMLHGDSHDYMIGFSREAKNISDRPAVLVIYEPK
ncbi:MAG TPA: DNRLRE domain-containing protein [Gemmataceae bacterium]|nr:DNRLRE domain-containing protein [Gemmataceae bacterium]